MRNRFLFLLAIAITVVTTTFAQTTPTFQADVEDLVLQASNKIVYSAKTIVLADSLMKAVGDDVLMDSIVNTYNTSFIGVDWYYGESPDEVINDIVQHQSEAVFTDFDIRKVSVVVRTDGDLYLAVITSQF